MAYTGDVADRPDTLDGCWQTWTESQTDNVVKSAMDSGVVKTRRRFTGIQRKAQVSVTLAADLYQDFQDWYNIYQSPGKHTYSRQDAIRSRGNLAVCSATRL